jgi:transposase
VADDPGRYGTVRALGMDEVLFVRWGTYHKKEFTTQLVDVEHAQLLDIVPGRSGEGPKAWLEAKGDEWRGTIEVGTLDMSGPYRAVFNEKLPHVTQVADPLEEKLLGLLRAGDPKSEVPGTPRRPSRTSTATTTQSSPGSGWTS